MAIAATIALAMASCGDGYDPNVNPSYENGVLPGKFSVSNSQYVHFSQGNLQYCAHLGEWRFADNQWDTIGVGNKQIGEEGYEGWIDLFGWGTGTNPTEASGSDKTYASFNEWGDNTISNGGNAPNRWKTLSSEQMLYLFRNRENAVSLFGFGSIDGVNGIILLPDDWSTSNAPDFKPILKSGYTWDGSKYTLSPDCFSANTLTVSDWQQHYERFGAVFLPAGGMRWGHNMYKAAGEVCYYWCRDKEEGKAYPHALFSDEEDFTPASYCSQCYGQSVRLVQYEDKVFPQGAVKGEFSVSDNKKVYFSKGNLQYQHSNSNQRWQFALYAWQVIGAANANIAADYDGWIDLFGWGTGDEPTKSSQDNADYADFHEWGDHPILNGGNMEKKWRTLDGDEWGYLFHRKNDAAWGAATVNDVAGIIILPDAWQQPADVPVFKSSIGNDDGLKWSSSNYFLNENNLNYRLNVYTDEEWLAMEANGAVFLPATGFRKGLSVEGVKNSGCYWSSKPISQNSAYRCGFGTKRVSPESQEEKYNGCAVRLVQDVK